MNKIFLLILAFWSLTLKAQIINIPDYQFKKALILYGIDKNGDGEIQVAETQAVDSIFASSFMIKSLKGIEAFSSLKYLSCFGNELTNLDVSANTKLEWLECYGNQLTTLNVSKNIELYYLNCQRNQLVSLDLNTNRKLYYLRCDWNQLTHLDLSDLDLCGLFCNNNQLEDLDVSKNQKLCFLYCDQNKLKYICINQIQFDRKVGDWVKDDLANLVTNCMNSVSNIENTSLKIELVKVYNLLGQEVPLENLLDGIYIFQYKDGTVKRRWNSNTK